MSLDYQELISKIKQKKELSAISDQFVHNVIEELTKKDVSLLTDPRSLLKKARAELRLYAGRFNSPKKAMELLNKGQIEDLLKAHSSTRERLPYYETLKKIILSYDPNSILDLGCGLNPLAIAHVKTNWHYNALDINQANLDLISQFFKMKKIKGNVFFADLRNETTFPAADLCLLLKVVDLIDKNGHKQAEKLLVSLKCPTIIISFSTKTLSNRPMNHPQRGWIERLLSRLGYGFTIQKIPNEIFYIIRKFNR